VGGAGEQAGQIGADGTLLTPPPFTVNIDGNYGHKSPSIGRALPVAPPILTEASDYDISMSASISADHRCNQKRSHWKYSGWIAEFDTGSPALTLIWVLPRTRFKIATWTPMGR